MRPLSDHTPKPMLPVRGKPLMQWAMESMQRAGVQDLVVNTAWLGEQIPMHFGSCFDVAAEKPSHKSEDTDPAVTAALKPMQMHYSQEGVDFGNAKLFEEMISFQIEAKNLSHEDRKLADAYKQEDVKSHLHERFSVK